MRSDHGKSKTGFLCLASFRGLLSLILAQTDIHAKMRCNIFFYSIHKFTAQCTRL